MSKVQRMQVYDRLNADESGHIEVVRGKSNPYEGEWEWPADRWPVERFLHRDSCPYCGSIMRRGVVERNNDPDIVIFELLHCRTCAFWQLMHKYVNQGRMLGGIDWDIFTPNLREFDTRLPEGPASELALSLRRNAKLWRTFTPSALERFVADVFRINYGHCEVTHVGRRGDLGIDIVVVDDGGHSWQVQVKHHDNNRAESVDTIRYMAGVMVIRGFERALVVTDADSFTRAAKEEAGMPTTLTIKLVDKRTLDRLLDPFIPPKPWLAANQDFEPEMHEVLPELEEIVAMEPQVQLHLFPERRSRSRRGRR